MSEDVGKHGQVKALMIDGSMKWIDPPDNDFDRLLMRYQEEYEKHRWIPCAERMPEEDVDVLIYYKGDDDYDPDAEFPGFGPQMIVARFCTGLRGWAGVERPHKGWVGGESCDEVQCDDLTHWMPLPEGPEVKG